MIGSLPYLTTSRLGVMQVVGQVARFQEAPKEPHVLAMKMIFKCLKGTIDFGISYPKENYLTLVSYIDADWEGSIDDRRSTSGVAFYLGDCLVSWLSKKQSLVSLSAVEVEYIAVVACCTQVLQMKKLYKEYR